MTFRSVQYVHHQNFPPQSALLKSAPPPHAFLIQLMTLFLHNSTRILQSWTVTGVGLRRALEVGAHRKHLGAASLTIENELWRRAFWYGILLDPPLPPSRGAEEMISQGPYRDGLGYKPRLWQTMHDT